MQEKERRCCWKSSLMCDRSETDQDIRSTDISLVTLTTESHTWMRDGESFRDLSFEIIELQNLISFFSHHIHEAHDNVIFEMEEVFLRTCQLHEKRKKKAATYPISIEGDKPENIISDVFAYVVHDGKDNEKEGKEDDDRYDDAFSAVENRALADVIKKSEKVISDGIGNAAHDVKDKEEEGKEEDLYDDAMSATENRALEEEIPTDKEAIGEVYDVVKQKIDGVPMNETKRSCTEVASFTHGNQCILTISPISDTHAWINEYVTEQVVCVDMNGYATTVRKINNYTADLTLLQSNEFIFTVFGGKAIGRSLPLGVMKKICSKLPLHPVGICRAYDEGLLVCIVESNVSQITPDTRGEVHHMKMPGKILRKYKRSRDDTTKLFTCPKRVTQNINMGICVVDYVNKDFTSLLVVLSMDGSIRFVYRGQPTLKMKFASDDVCCDMFGRILVTDFFNSAVHQLSPSGDFLQLLLTKQDLPVAQKSLALYGDNLWVGCREGVVKVF